MDLDLPDLMTLHVLLDEGTVGGAARRLGIAQSSMSHRLARLRDRLGDPLLVRDGAAMVPTARAQQLADPLAAALRDLQQLLEVPEPFDPARSQLEIVVHLPDLVMSVVPSLVEGLAREAPGIVLRVRSVPADVSRVLSGTTPSLAVVPAHFMDERTRSVRVGDQHFAVAARRAHPLFAEPLTTARWLRWPQVVVRTGNPAPNLIEQHLREAGHERRVGLEVPSFLAGLLALSASDLVMNVPMPMSAAALATLGLAAVDVPMALPRVRLAMAWHERFHRDPGHRWVRSRVHDALRSVAAG